MKKQIILVLTLLLCLNGFSQQIQIANDMVFYPLDVNRSTVKALGTPYITEEYQKVRIKGFEDKIYSGRYNAFLDEMEILISSDSNPIALNIADNDYEVIFLNENKIYRSFEYENYRGIVKRGFLVILSEDNGTLLLKEEVIKFYEKVEATSSYDKDKPAKFRKEDDNYYIKIKSGKIVSLPTKSKDIAKGFPEKGNEIENFIKKNKLKTKNEDDLIKIANFIGSL